MSIRLTVFDVAGTTVLDGDAVIEAMKTALSAAGIDAPRSAITAVMGIPKPAAIRRVMQAHAATPTQAANDRTMEIHAAFVELLVERYRRDPMIRPAPGALDVFRWLRDGGVRVALDTGFSREILDVLLARLQWDRQIVDVTVASDEVVQGRPHPDLIFRAMQLTGISDPAQVAKIGDTPADIDEGRAAGCGLVVGVTYGTHSRGELEPFAVPLIDRLPDLLPLVDAA